jgi:hypothetical protein
MGDNVWFSTTHWDDEVLLEEWSALDDYYKRSYNNDFKEFVKVKNSGFSGFPFPITQVAQDEVGTGTGYPVECTLDECAELYWRIRRVEITSLSCVSPEYYFQLKGGTPPAYGSGCVSLMMEDGGGEPEDYLDNPYLSNTLNGNVYFRTSSPPTIPSNKERFYSEIESEYISYQYPYSGSVTDYWCELKQETGLTLPGGGVEYHAFGSCGDYSSMLADGETSSLYNSLPAGSVITLGSESGYSIIDNAYVELRAGNSIAQTPDGKYHPSFLVGIYNNTPPGFGAAICISSVTESPLHHWGGWWYWDQEEAETLAKAQEYLIDSGLGPAIEIGSCEFQLSSRNLSVPIYSINSGGFHYGDYYYDSASIVIKPIEYWPYANSQGSPVWDTNTGSQRVLPNS